MALCCSNQLFENVAMYLEFKKVWDKNPGPPYMSNANREFVADLLDNLAKVCAQLEDMLAN